MVQATDPVTFTVPRTILTDIIQLSDELTDKMHQLLERNTDGQLGSTEKGELETLVQMAQFAQIVYMALHPPRLP